MKSTLTIKDLVQNAAHQGHEAIALTDYNVLYEAIEFYEMALEENIQPIIGLTLEVEGYITKTENYPLILLAKNYAGYQELIQLSTMHQLAEDESLALSEVILRSEDLYVFAPGIEGEIVSLLEMERVDEAAEVARYFDENFSNFYLGVSLQHENQAIFSFYNNMNIPLVALGNVQYLAPEDAMPTKVLQVLESDMALGEENQAAINRFLTRDEGDFSLTPPEETFTRFKEAGFEEAALTTQKIAHDIQLEIPLDEQIMPSFSVPEGETSDSYLRKLCFENLENRVNHVTEAYEQRIEKELAVISEMGFSDYFLIVWDIMVYAHQKNIYTGSGRGSAAGSLVAFLLEITNVDPIKYDLLFERFLNKNRYTMPDIDLDFPDNRREEILQYIYNKYGTEYVAQIGTIGTYGAKSAVRDVGRVLGLSQEELRRWSKAIPSGPDVDLENSMNQSTFENLVNESEQNRRIYTIARKIEGRNRHVSTHAAAVVIADHPLTDRVPLQKGSGDIQLTQFTMDAVENVGLLKLDILGLRNLSILADCIRFIPYENKGEKIDIDAIPFDDQQTLEVFRKGQTDGVFQFESPGIRRVLRKLQPNSFEDVVAVNALYRPGPMEQIDTFIKRKNGEEPIRYPHDDLKDILEITYGVMVYQEQVMQVASKLAGYSLNEADILRRNISKKDHQAIEEGRKTFVEGALKKGYTKETALEVYSYIEKFADYGFNRSHAVAYSKVAYQLAYVKANYPASFFAAVMNASGKEKRKSFVTEAKRAGVKFLGPDINKSYRALIIENNKIRFGFDVIQGLPRNFIQEIVEERQENGQYNHLIHFLSRMDNRWLDEEQILPLIHSGSFDDLKDTRASLLDSLTSVVESIGMSHGNTELFDIFAPKIVEKPELSDEEKMKQEFEATGYYFTAEPGEQYKVLRNDPAVAYIADASKSKKITLLVVVDEITRIQTKNGHPMSFADVVDSSGKASLTLFPNVHRRSIQNFDEGDTILVEGEVEQNQYPVKIIANKITNADDLLQKEESPRQNQVLYIRFQSLENEGKKLEALQKVLNQYHGNVPVIIFDQETKEQKAFKKEYYASKHPKLLEILEKMFGNDNFVLKKVEMRRN
jgi:DNA polymerase-3 subunit alpha